MLDVVPINNNMTNCFIPICIENVLSEYLSFMGYEYQYVFAHAMNFKFERLKCDTGRLADGLYLEYNSVGWLCKLYDIYVEDVCVTSFDSLVDYISRSIERNNPVIIHLDSYYLPWSTLYKKEHTIHMVIVVDISEDKNEVVVVDTIEKENYFSISKEILEKGCKFIWEVKLPQNAKKINEIEYDRKIASGEIVLIPSERISMLKEFAVTFRRVFNPCIEFRDMYNLDLMRTEKLVDDIRKNILQINLFCKWMQWRDENTNVKKYTLVKKLYLQIMSKWNVCVNLLYKNCLTGWRNSFLEQGYNILSQIIELEQYAYDEFARCEKKEMKIEKCGVALAREKVYYSISLEKVFNNKGFCIETKNRYDEDLTGVGEYFVIESKVVKELDILSINLGNDYDNVICRGQEVVIYQNKETYEIIFLACAEWGAVDESLTIVGEDDTQKVTIHIQDLSQVDEGERFYCGKTFDTMGNIIQNNAAVFLYRIQYKNMCVKKVILPYSPNVHILSMALIGRK